MISVRLGEPVPLTLQLFDQATSENVFVYVYSVEGQELYRGTLDHVARGLYVNNEFAMPALAYIVAQYEVLGSDEYESPSEVFALDQSLDLSSVVASSAADFVVEKTGALLEGVSLGFSNNQKELMASVESVKEHSQALFDERVPTYADYWTGHMVDETVDQSFWEGKILSGTVETSGPK